MSPTSATRPHNPGGVARGRARCAHLSFPSATVLRVITSPGHRTQYTHHAPPGIISSHLASSAVRIPRTCVRVPRQRRCPWTVFGPSVVYRCFSVLPWPVGGSVVRGRFGAIYFFFVPSSRLTHSHVSPPPTSAKTIITIINNNIVINNNMSYNPTYVLILPVRLSC